MSLEVMRVALKAAKKSGTVWVRVGDREPRLAWAAWSEAAGGVVLVAGGGEQEVPGLVDGARAEMTVAMGGATVSRLDVAARALAPDEPSYSHAATVLAERRLNSGSPAELVARWREGDATVYCFS